MKIRIYNHNGIKETWYDVQSFSIEYQERNCKTYWIFLSFKEGSPNWRKFLPYGECTIEYLPKQECIDVKEDQ